MKYWTLILIILLSAGATYGQSRSKLEKQRKQLLKEIKLTNKLLRETSKDRASSLTQLETLKRQIASRKKLIKTIESEMELVDETLGRNTAVVDALEEDLLVLENEYREMARHAFRQKMQNNQLVFLLSAKDFNDAMERWQYLKTYQDYRKRQSRIVTRTQEILQEKVCRLEEEKLLKENLLNTYEEQLNLMGVELEDKGRLFRSLKEKEGKLRSDLAEQKTTHEKLNKTIEDIIQKEIAARRKKARTPKKTEQKAEVASRPTIVTAFDRKKGKLDWPVDEGVITRRFGQQPHPTIPKIMITNNGIDIRASRQAKVRAIFEGEVVGRQFVPGHDYMLIITHGDYYSVYSHLKEVYVKKGEKVSTRQPIGRLSVDERTNSSVVHLEIWRDKVRLNPTDWLGKN